MSKLDQKREEICRALASAGFEPETPESSFGFKEEIALEALLSTYTLEKKSKLLKGVPDVLARELLESSRDCLMPRRFWSSWKEICFYDQYAPGLREEALKICLRGLDDAGLHCDLPKEVRRKGNIVQVLFLGGATRYYRLVGIETPEDKKKPPIKTFDVCSGAYEFLFHVYDYRAIYNLETIDPLFIETDFQNGNFKVIARCKTTHKRVTAIHIPFSDAFYMYRELNRRAPYTCKDGVRRSGSAHDEILKIDRMKFQQNKKRIKKDQISQKRVNAFLDWGNSLENEDQKQLYQRIKSRDKIFGGKYPGVLTGVAKQMFKIRDGEVIMQRAPLDTFTRGGSESGHGFLVKFDKRIKNQETYWVGFTTAERC